MAQYFGYSASPIGVIRGDPRDSSGFTGDLCDDWHPGGESPEDLIHMSEESEGKWI